MLVKIFQDIALIALVLSEGTRLNPAVRGSWGCRSDLLLRQSLRRAFLNAVSACKSSARIDILVVFARCLRQIDLPFLVVIHELLNRPAAGRTRG
jgi:hypothetical protein